MRNYQHSIEALCDGYGIQKSSVSRHFVAASRQELEELLNRQLSDLDIGAIFLDGVHVIAHVGGVPVETLLPFVRAESASCRQVGLVVAILRESLAIGEWDDSLRVLVSGLGLHEPCITACHFMFALYTIV